MPRGPLPSHSITSMAGDASRDAGRDAGEGWTCYGYILIVGPKGNVSVTLEGSSHDL